MGTFRRAAEGYFAYLFSEILLKEESLVRVRVYREDHKKYVIFGWTKKSIQNVGVAEGQEHVKVKVVLKDVVRWIGDTKGAVIIREKGVVDLESCEGGGDEVEDVRRGGKISGG